MRSVLRVVRSAPMMMFQDLGRYGYAHVGVSQGGALDLHAYCWGNYLLGNAAGAVSVEVTVGNAVFEALEDVVVAISGAEMDARIDGVCVKNWGTHLVRKGQCLKLGYARSGCHAYVAVRGGFCVEEVLGSGSTVIRNDVGRLLVEGDELDAEWAVGSSSVVSRCVPGGFVPDYGSVCEVRVILPSGESGQEAGGGEALLSMSFVVSVESDRMGRRLVGEGVMPRLEGIVSEGISLGTIQLPPDGCPIVLLNDRQTQGGYAKVGSVARVDLPLLVQVRAGARVKFVRVSVEEAEREWGEFVRFFGL